MKIDCELQLRRIILRTDEKRFRVASQSDLNGICFDLLKFVREVA